MTTQTILQYNGIRLQNVQTLNFIETPINDDSGQYLYTKTELKVLGYFAHAGNATTNKMTLGAFPVMGNTSGEVLGPSNQYAILKHYLNQPRRRLVYSTMAIGSATTPAVEAALEFAGRPLLGTPLFIIEPAEELMVDAGNDVVNMLVKNDVKAGPIPGPVVVTHVANNQVWRVEFSVTFHTVPPCIARKGGAVTPLANGDSLTPYEDIGFQVDMTNIPTTHTAVQRQLGVLSNRWSCNDRIDENSYTTRTYTGNVLLANPNWNPNDFRAITIPPVVPGMQRRSIEYTTSEDNLSLRYVVTDHEVTVTAPRTASTMRIVHNEAIHMYGGKASFTLRVMLTGDRFTKLSDLMVLAMAIAEQRLLVTVPIVPAVKTTMLMQRQEFTTEQGTDQNHSLSLVISGERLVDGGKDAAEILEVQRRLVSKSVTWRPVASAAGVLTDYNNVLSKGNRPGEQPDTEGGIPALSCLHAKLTSPCSTQFTMEASTPDSDEITKKIRRSDNLRLSTDLYNTEELYAAYPTSIDIQINTNLAESPTNVIYSDSHHAGLYSHYNISSMYGSRGLNVALPVAQTYGTPETSNVVVSIGPRQPTRRIRIEAERVGSPPQLPEPVHTFTEESLKYSSVGVTNTLQNSKVTHLNPAPVADGVSLIYTSHLEMEYLQNMEPAKHRFGVPDYIKPTTSTPSMNPVTDVGKYSFELASLFIPDTLNNSSSWNA